MSNAILHISNETPWNRYSGGYEVISVLPTIILVFFQSLS